MGADGKLVWITGLSGAGKTTIAKEIYKRIKRDYPNTLHLDGDELREILSGMGSHTDKGRKRTAEVYARLCGFLTDQGVNVIISTISLYHSLHKYNRKMNKNYYEILVEVDRDVLLKRNKKGLYNPEAKNVMGMDQEPEFPKDPTVIVQNNTRDQLNENIKSIIKAVME